MDGKKVKKMKNFSAVVKKLVEIKGSLYLCIPKSIVRQCGVQVGDQVGIIAEKKLLTVVLAGASDD